MKQGEAKSQHGLAYRAAAGGKENISVKPPRKPGLLSPKESKNSVAVDDAEIKNLEAAKEKSTKEVQSFFMGKFGESGWRASPIMQDYVMRSRSVLEVKKDIMSTLRSTSVPRASDLRMQRSKITPPPFTSIVGSTEAVYENKESRKSTPSPLGGISHWADISPFTAKRRQGLGSAPPWSGIKAEESWQKASATSRTPSPHTFAPGGPSLPSFSRTPPKLAVSAGRREPKSDTRPERIPTNSTARVRNLVGQPSDSTFSKSFNIRSLTPNSVVQNRNRDKVTQLKSIPQRNGLSSVIPTTFGKHSGTKGKALVNPFSSGGAFKVVQRGSSGVPRVHRLSKSLQKMGLGGQQNQRETSDGGRLSEKRGMLKMEKVPEDEAGEAKELNQGREVISPKDQGETSESLTSDQPRTETQDSETNAEESNIPYFDNTDHKSGSLQHNGPQDIFSQQQPQQQEYVQARQAGGYNSMLSHQRSPIGPNGQYLLRQQCIQTSQFSPQQYSFTSPQFSPAVQPMMTMPPLQLQPQMAPHMVQSKPAYIHPAYGRGFTGMMPGPVDGNVDPQMGYSQPQFGGSADYGIMPVRYPPSDIQYSRQAPQAPPQVNHHKKNHEKGALPASLHDLQGKLNILMNQNSNNNGEIERVLPMIEGRVSLLAKTQTGSRFLQQRIADGHPGYFSVVMKEVFADLPALMVDLFGNYLCQKLIEKCNEVQRDTMLAKLSSHIPDISCDRQGTRAVQKIVSATTTHHQREMFMGSISREADLSRLMRDANGSHVIHAVLDKFPLSMLKPIFKLAYKSCYKLAVHQHGLCVLKKCMTLAKPEDFLDLSQKVLQRVLQLVNDQYGNYLIQHIIDRSIINKQNAEEGESKSSKNGDAISLLHAKLSSHYCRLSKQKFSSNVVEKCLRVGNSEWQRRIIDELMDKNNTSGNSVLSLLQDSYGNYVMQNALNVAQTEQAAELVQLIKPHLSALRKNIKKKWERLILAKSNSIPQSSVKANTKSQGTWNGQQGKHTRNNKMRSRHTNPQHKGSQQRQQQHKNHNQHQHRNWSNAGFIPGYSDPYSTNGSSVHQMHDVMMRSQPSQMHPPQISSQLHHSTQLHPSSQIHAHPNMQPNIIYSQPYIPQIRYPQQPSQMYVEPHVHTHGGPSF